MKFGRETSHSAPLKTCHWRGQSIDGSTKETPIYDNAEETAVTSCFHWLAAVNYRTLA